MHLYKNRILLLLLLCQASSSVKNSLNFFAIISTGIRNLPNLFTTVIDNIQLDYYDGNGIRKQSSILWKNISDLYPAMPFSEKELNLLDYNMSIYLNKLGTLYPNEAVHVLQCMSGCQLDEKTIEAVLQCGYNGHDFIKMDKKNLTLIVQNPLAASFKQEWNSDQQRSNDLTQFLLQICPQMLHQFVTRSALQREDLTSVALLQRTPSTPVSCFATGFYPNTAKMFWMKDGEEIQDNMNLVENLPNHDDTYQMTVDLNVLTIGSEDWKRYDCVFKLSNNTIITRLEKAAINTNFVSDPELSTKFPLDLAIGLVVGLFLLCICISGLFLWKNAKNASYFPDTPSYPIYPSTTENCQDNFELQ